MNELTDLKNKTDELKNKSFAGVSTGAIVTGLGLILWSPIVGGFNLIGILLTLVGLIAFGGFAKDKWY